MRTYETHYNGTGSIVVCADQDAARRISALDFAALFGACEPSAIAVVDMELSCREAPHHWPVFVDHGVMELANAHLDGLDLFRAKREAWV